MIDFLKVWLYFEISYGCSFERTFEYYKLHV